MAAGSASFAISDGIASAAVRLELLRSSEVEQSGSNPGLGAGSNPVEMRARARISISPANFLPTSFWVATKDILRNRWSWFDPNTRSAG